MAVTEIVNLNYVGNKLRNLQRFMKNIKTVITNPHHLLKNTLFSISNYLGSPYFPYTKHSKNEKITSLILKRLSPPLKQRMGWRKRRLTYWSYVIFGWSPLDSPQ